MIFKFTKRRSVDIKEAAHARQASESARFVTYVDNFISKGIQLSRKSGTAFAIDSMYRGDLLEETHPSTGPRFGRLKPIGASKGLGVKI